MNSFTPCKIVIKYFPVKKGGIYIQATPAVDDIGHPPPQDGRLEPTYEPDYNSAGLRQVLAEVIDKILAQRKPKSWPKLQPLTLDDASQYLSFDPNYTPRVPLDKVPNGNTTINEIDVTYNPVSRLFTIYAYNAANNTEYTNSIDDQFFLLEEVFSKIWFNSSNGTQVKLTINGGDIVETP